MQLEKKEDMRRRGVSIPDNADALAITFAYPVASSEHSKALRSRNKSSHSFEYEPFQDEWNAFKLPTSNTSGRQR